MGRPKSATNMENAHLRMPDWMLTQVDRVARERGVARSRVIVDAVKRQLGIEAPNVFDLPPGVRVGGVDEAPDGREPPPASPRLFPYAGKDEDEKEIMTEARP